MRPVEDGGAEAHRLDRVVAADGHQRAAEEGDRRDAIEEAEFAERVGEVDVGFADQRLAAAPLRDRQAARAASMSRIAAPRSGWRGTMMVRTSGWRSRRSRWAAATISSSPSWVRGGDPDRPAGDRGAQARDLAGVGGERRRVELEVAGDPHLRRAERAEARAVLLGLGEDEADPREQRAPRRRRSAASRGRSGRTGGR